MQSNYYSVYKSHKKIITEEDEYITRKRLKNENKYYKERQKQSIQIKNI